MSWQKLDERWQAAFKDPILKAIRIYFGHDALEGVPKDKFIDPKRILNSRLWLRAREATTSPRLSSKPV